MSILEKIENISDEEINEKLKEMARIKIGCIKLERIFFDKFSKIEKNDEKVEKIYVNSIVYQIIRKFLKGQIDPNCNKEILVKTGIIGYLWEIPIIIDNKLDDDTIIVK